MSKSFSILIVDDHAAIRAGIRSALTAARFTTIYEAASYSEALACVATTKPDVLIVDIHLGDGDGLSLVRWVRSISNTIPIVVLSLADSDQYIVAAMSAGASAFVSKSSPLSEFIAAFEHALIAPETFSSRLLPSAAIRAKKVSLLTPRELSIMTQLSNGLPNRELAQSLFISEATLKSHLSAIFRKLGVKNRIQAIAAAKEAGLLQEES